MPHFEEVEPDNDVLKSRRAALIAAVSPNILRFLGVDEADLTSEPAKPRSFYADEDLIIGCRAMKLGSIPILTVMRESFCRRQQDSVHLKIEEGYELFGETNIIKFKNEQPIKPDGEPRQLEVFSHFILMESMPDGSDEILFDELGRLNRDLMATFLRC